MIVNIDLFPFLVFFIFFVVSAMHNSNMLPYHISQVTHADFKKAKEKVMFKKKEGVPEGLYM